MTSTPPDSALLEFILDRMNVGVFALNKNMEIVVWNHFMATNSEKKAEDVVGKNLFEAFPELPRSWLEKKIRGVFVLKNFAFTSWEQRPYLFKFPHNRPITGGVDSMRQNCTFLPVKGANGDVELVCVTVVDVTDTSIYQSMLEEALAKLNEANNRDGLTGVYNRRYLEEILSKEYNRVNRYGGTLSFMLLDLDDFKQVNDEKGHLAGDEVLRRSAEVLNAGIRDADTLGRYGGEEFGVVLPHTTIEGAAALAERLRESMEKNRVVFRDQQINVTVSIGVSQLTDETKNYEHLIEEADTALYTSKENGRNRVTIFKP